jgi:streptothricin acetyltransferase
MYKILKFDETMLSLLPHSEGAFDIVGRLIPRYDGREWSVSEELLDVPTTKTYPIDEFDPREYVDNPDKAAFIAFCDEQFAGYILIGRRWNGNAFVDGFGVDPEYRGKGIGTALMNAAVEWSKAGGYNGISLETQDDNLLACRFYLRYGFNLGGIDRRVYTHKDYLHETALYFYLSI